MEWRTKLKKIMSGKGINQKILAESLGVSPGAVSHIFQQEDVRLSTLEKVANVLGIELAELLTDKEDRQDSQNAEIYDEKYRETHVHGYLRVGTRIIEINSLKELKDAVVTCEVNYLK